MEGKLLVDGLMLGEGPHWDAATNSLIFVDIFGKSVHRYRPSDKHHTSVTLNDDIGAAVPVEGSKGQFLIGLGRSIAKLAWDPDTGVNNVSIIATVENDKPGNRLNDGKADPNGNFWIGSMGEATEKDGLLKMKQGALYKLNKKCEISTELDEVSLSNGLAWDSTKTKMFYIDTPLKTIFQFDYDPQTSKIGGKKVLFEFTKNGVEGLPDGMTIDKEDTLWIACWEGKQLIRVCTKTGKLMKQIPMPRKRVTSACFGGPQLKTLYVTFMATPEKDGKPAEPGALYAFEGLGEGVPSLNVGPLDCSSCS